MPKLKGRKGYYVASVYVPTSEEHVKIRRAARQMRVSYAEFCRRAIRLYFEMRLTRNELQQR
jgi:hypothetical protein